MIPAGYIELPVISLSTWDLIEVRNLGFLTDLASRALSDPISAIWNFGAMSAIHGDAQLFQNESMETGTIRFPRSRYDTTCGLFIDLRSLSIIDH